MDRQLREIDYVPIDKSNKNEYPPFLRQDRWTVYEVLKIVFIGFPILFPIRMITLFIEVIIWVIYSRVIVFHQWMYCHNGAKRRMTIDDFPKGSLRRRLYSFMRTWVRVGLFTCGFHHINRLYLNKYQMRQLRNPIQVNFCTAISSNGDGRIFVLMKERNVNEVELVFDNTQTADQPELLEEPEDEMSFITVCNHVSFADAFVVVQELAPVCILAKGSLRKVPIFGGEMVNLNCIFYNQRTKSTIIDTVKKRAAEFASDHTRSRLVIFPEGTTTNGTSLLKFHRGAFISGTPVQPVMLHYPTKHFSLSWDCISWIHWWVRMGCQFHNPVTMIFFPPYYPTQYEMDHPDVYAENVRDVMCKGMNMMIPEKNLQLSNCLFTRIPKAPSDATQNRQAVYSQTSAA